MDQNIYRSRNATDENSDILKRKAPRTTATNQTNVSITAPKRAALGNVSTNVNRTRLGLQIPAQRVQVHSQSVNDENEAPLSHKQNHPQQQIPQTAERRPLGEISSGFREYQHKGAEGENDDITSHIEQEKSHGDIIDGERYDDIPQGLMPKLTTDIQQELFHVFKRFYSERLDDEDEDSYDVSMVAEYSPEIFNYIHSLEVKYRPNPRYMEFQTELKWNMRSILIDWLVQVHSRFNLLPETLFLTVNYIDRFLSKRRVSLSRFQLVGAVALFIAAKYEEINCPSVQEIAYMVDHAYTVEDILKAERFMIDVLEFEMGWPGPMSFLRRTSKADEYDFETRTLAKYFLEITVMDYRFVASPPSWLAAGAHYLSRLLLSKGNWTEAHVYYSGYTAEQLKPLAHTLLEACRDPEEHHKSIYEKYQERRFRRSSLFVQEWFKLAGED